MNLMKKVAIILFLMVLSQFSFAQVYSGIAEIESAKREGFYLYTGGDANDLAESWKSYLKEYGAVEKGRNGAILASNSKIPGIEKKGFTISSKIFTEGNKNKLFVSIGYSTEEFIKSGHSDYRAASNWLEDFAKHFGLEENVRSEQTKLNEILAQKNKIIKNGERLVRELDANARQTEMLSKKLEEEKIKKEKIITNQEQNKLDLKTIEESVLQQTKNLETAKSKIK